jgi:NAD(P)-dependent dehydrogenase (short-subunit alcohol dehydrogenase family)
MKTIVITGASTGIGRATAEHLASRGWKVFAGVRKEADGAPLVEAQPNIIPIIIDVVKADQIRAAAHTVSAHLEGRTLDGLINNAGIANMGPLPVQPMDEIRMHFDINVLGAIEVSQNFLPLLGMDEGRQGAPGRIINISSFGGRIPSPFLGAYCATKAALESLTDSMRRELLPFGVDAITIAPGAIKTPIWDKAEEQDAKAPYSNTVWAEPQKKYTNMFLEAGEKGWPAIKIAELIETALTDAKPKAYYAAGPEKFSNYSMVRRLPKRLLDKGMGKRFGLLKD